MPARTPAPAIPLARLTLSRAQEREANYLAVQTAAEAGYDPAEMAACIDSPPAAGERLRRTPVFKREGDRHPQGP